MSRSTSQHSFAMVPQAQIPRSTFSRSHGYKTTFDSDYLIPFYVDEVLPGDTFNVRATLFARLATPISPMMDNMYLDSFYFYVPNRLLWANWHKFNGEQENPGDSTDYLIPTLTSPATYTVTNADDTTTSYTGWQVAGDLDGQGIFDYMGLPTGVAGLEVSSLHMRAYSMIWNEWFRDQNLQERAYCPTSNGPDQGTDTINTTTTNGQPLDYTEYFSLLKRAKRHDYFTSALPWPQKGPGVEIPIGDSATITGQIPVVGTGAIGLTDGTFYRTLGGSSSASSQQTSIVSGWTVSPVSMTAGAPVGTGGTISAGQSAGTNLANAATFRVGVSPNANQSGIIADASNAASTLSVDLGSATAVTINALRQAFQIQKLYERDARGGTRYTEIIRSHFGVISPDSRLQRPEYLGGSSQRVIVNPVAQTSSTDGSTPQGNLAAFGLVADSKGGFVKSFTEHGVIIGLLNVRADITYQQGVPRMFSRQSRFDFYWPALAHLGEQAILNKEIYAQGPSVLDTDSNIVDDLVFGYQERWAEYRYFPNQITGKFRSTYATSLDYWHLAEEFAELPTLSATWIQSNTPTDRVIAVPSEPHFILDVVMNIKCARPMPVYSVPGLIDHF